MFTVTRDADPRRPELFITREDGGRFIVVDGTTLVIDVRHARHLIDALMGQTYRINLELEPEDG
jgi:hypothetical protein